MQAASTTTKAGRIDDRIIFELWLTTPSLESEHGEWGGLVDLLDVALPIVDAKLARSTARTELGVDYAERSGFAFRSASTASTEGDPGDIPALVIPIAVRWPATAC
jgi:hypothetical protein